MTSSIDKWQASVTMQAVIREAKADERWASMMEKQEKKIEIKTTRVAVNKMREDYMSLTVDTSDIYDEVKAAHMLFSEAIFQEMGLHRATTTLCVVTKVGKRH
jgi:hypothetical protein